MASVRLTNALKDTLIRDLLEHGYGEKLQKLAEDHAAVAQEIYEHLFEGSVEKMRELPVGWLPTVRNFKISMPDGTMLQCNLDGCMPISRRDLFGFLTYTPVEIERQMWRVPSEKRYSALGILKDQKLLSKLKELEKRKDSYESDAVDDYQQIRATLNQVSTIKKLIQIWPEVKPFASKYEKKPQAALPAVPVTQLNSSLGLPV